MAVTEAQGLHRLRANLLEIQAQAFLNTRQFDRARESLENAAQVLRGTGAEDALFVAKWSRVVNFYAEPESEECFRALLDIRRQAVELKHWETLRDLDQHLASVRQDMELYHRLYFGTPFPCYRQGLVRRLSRLPEPPDAYLWLPGNLTERAPRVRKVLDLATLEMEGQPMELKSGQLLHRLLTVLASDFYRPRQTAALAAQLFPDEYFHPHTTPNRIYQLVKRVREWARNSRLALTVEELDGSYRIMPHGEGGLALKIPRPEEPSAADMPVGHGVPDFKLSARLKPLEAWIGAAPFFARDAAQHLKISVSTVTRLLRMGIKEGRVEKLGAGPQLHYQFIMAKKR